MQVFIGGGGELATAREVLRYPSVEKVIMVDLDKDVRSVFVVIFFPMQCGECLCFLLWEATLQQPKINFLYVKL